MYDMRGVAGVVGSIKINSIRLNIEVTAKSYDELYKK